jgi:hypothetical protein
LQSLAGRDTVVDLLVTNRTTLLINGLSGGSRR